MVMADAVITVLVDRVAEIIEDTIRGEVNLVRGVKKNVQHISDELQTIKTVLDDAEKREAKEESVKKWLKKLEATAYQMDDILDEWEYAHLKHKKEKVRFSSLKKLADRRNTAKKIQYVKVELDRISKEKDYFNFVISPPSTHPVPISWRGQSTSSIDLNKIYGRDDDMNKMVRKVINGDSQITCIVGMGGIGKTTLAQLVYNDAQVQSCFELRIWICVSDPFDVAGIAKGIIQKLTGEIIPANTNVQLDFVLEKLRDLISGKKFLLVLDDVWTDKYDEWEPLIINLRYGAPTCKILVTTRNERVGKMMMRGNVGVEIYHPQKLTDEECWQLLRGASLAGRSEEECREFEDVGKKIASKCDGLPLAANVLGSLLQFKSNLAEWEHVLDSEIWQLKEAEVELFPHLLLSYNELSPPLKRCFSYCAIYPKDYTISAAELIEEWMALGYLGSVTRNDRVEFLGRDYFNNLATRCLFQDFKRIGRQGEEIEVCKMHDIVHDFAHFLRKNNGMSDRICQVCNPFLLSQAQDYRSLVWDRELPIRICDCVTSVRVFRLKPGPYIIGTINRNLLGMEKFIHLRRLELSSIELSKDDLNIICRLYFLQTLLLVGCSLKKKKIPREIGNLVRLRRLDVSWNEELKELPESICCLVELQVFDIGRCGLERLPGEIGNLVKLRRLNLCFCTELKVLPESMCSLVELQILGIYQCSNLSRLPEGIHRLKNLQHLILDWSTPLSDHLPQEVGQLSGLRSFGKAFHGGRSGCNKLGLLKDLNCLTGSLDLRIEFSSISDLEELVEDAREAKLGNKVHIQSLCLNFNGEINETERSSSSLLMDVIEALEPHHKLEELVIWFYKGSRLPCWISSRQNLVKQISLFYLSKLSSLPPLGKLPFLECLDMYGLDTLKLVEREFLGLGCSLSSSTSNEVVAFPKLKQLTFDVCIEWEEWEDITAEEEESTAVFIMPCLTQLQIRRCGRLKKLPHRLLRKASSFSLESVEISDSLELIQKYRGDGPYFAMPCRNNSHLDSL